MMDSIKLTALVGVLFVSWFALAASYAIKRRLAGDGNTTLFVGS